MDSRAAIVRVGWTPGRSEPDHRAEMVTQWLCGEALAVERREAGGGAGDDWLRVRGPDGYRCWVSAGGLVSTDEAAASRWVEAASHLSLGVGLDGRGKPGAPRWLPRGARVALDDGVVRLPDGGTGVPERPDDLVALEELEAHFPARPDAVATSALGWRGVPYLWGGRTTDGVDCSGLAQAVYALHGVDLPRDGGDQLRATGEARVEAPDPGRGAGPTDPDGATDPGDLLFFGEGEERVTHVALSLGGLEILHAAAARGAVCEDDLGADDPLARRLRARLLAVTRPLSLRG